VGTHYLDVGHLLGSFNQIFEEQYAFSMTYKIRKKSIGFVTGKIETKIDYFHVLGLFMTKNLMCWLGACNLPHIGKRDGLNLFYEEICFKKLKV
jgi:hypothetical protein